MRAVRSNTRILASELGKVSAAAPWHSPTERLVGAVRAGADGRGPRLEDVVVIALAASRIARAVSVDEISAGFREQLTRSAEREIGSKFRDRGRRLLADLIGCPVCTGWWASIGLSLLWPGRFRMRRGLSVAGLQVLLTFAERLVSEQGRAAVAEADQLASMTAEDAGPRRASNELRSRDVR